MNWQHVYPINDIKEHDIEGTWQLFNEKNGLSPFCGCLPEIDWEHKIVIHNAYDMREAQEYINQPFHG